MNKKNREFLEQEYKQHGKEPLFVKINNEKLIMPYIYSTEETPEICKRYFISDYLDLQRKEIEKYKEAGLEPKVIHFNGTGYVVPFRMKDSNRKDTEIVEAVLTHSRRKYNRAVSLTRKLNEAYPDEPMPVNLNNRHVEIMQKRYRDYLWQKYKDQIKTAAIRAAEFAEAGIERLSPEQKRKLKRSTGKLLVVLAIAGAGLAAANHLSKKAKEKKEAKTELNNPQIMNEAEDDIEITADFAKEAEAFYEEEHPAADKDDIKIRQDEKAAVALAQNFKRSDAAKNKMFARFMADIFENEGGYADKTIDQPTNMGIIQPTLNTFCQRYPQEAKKLKMPQTVKGLKKGQAQQIYRRLYFDQYQIGNYRNESIALLIYDIYVNHTPTTAKQFIDQGLKAARKNGAKVKLPQSTTERVAEINKLAHHPKAEKAFYDMLMKERRFHMYKKTRGKAGEKSRFADGLRNRANKYNNLYVSTVQQEHGISTLLASRQTGR